MCGITCYVSYQAPQSLRRTLNNILSSLELLEYRGYDSAGFCVQSTCSSEPTIPSTIPPTIMKAVGNVDCLRKHAYEQLTDQELDQTSTSHIAIAHTRWATHGKPSTSNCHPHTSDASASFVIVHNGVITNHQDIRQRLIDQGYTFESETDSEVIPKLCQQVWNDRMQSATPSQPVTFTDVVSFVLRQLEGTYAIAFVSSLFPNELIASKRGSSLILGFPASFLGHSPSKDSPFECWLASDASAIVCHTNHVMYLEDFDLVHIHDGCYSLYNNEALGLYNVTRLCEQTPLSSQNVSKGAYPHYMLKEIHEQKESIVSTLLGRVCIPSRPIPGSIKLGGIQGYLETIRHSQRIILIGCGTSYNACMSSRSCLEHMCKMPILLELASDFMDRTPALFRNDTCIFVSQSGETADTLRALEYAKRRGALCIGITNVAGSAIGRSTHCGIHQNAGCEIGVASTKAYTSQIMCLVLLALMIGQDHVSNNGIIEEVLQELNTNFPDSIQAVLDKEEEYISLADALFHEKSMLFTARGNNLGTAMEACLKIKEVALIHCEAVCAGELKHGPLALIDDSFPVVVIVTEGRQFAQMHSVIEQLSTRNSSFYVLANKPITTKAKAHIVLPVCHEFLQPILNIIPFQLLAYHIACKKGLNVDQPRNLAKSVTVSD